MSGAIRIADHLARALTIACAFLLILLTIIVGWQIFGRFVLNDTPKWTEQLAGILIVYLALLGGAAAIWDRRHIAMTMLQDRLPVPLRWIVVRLLLLAIAGLGLVMMYHGAVMIELVHLWQLPALGISRSVNYLAFPVAGAAIIYFVLVQGLLMGGEDQT